MATWNLERAAPGGWAKAPGQRCRMEAVDADVWVLTETHVEHYPTEKFRDVGHVVLSPPHPQRRPVDERWTAIWSRWPLEPIVDPAPHRCGTVAAVVQHPDRPFVVYGAVLAWANERTFDDGSPARMWQVHYAEIDRAGRDWAAIRRTWSDLPLVVAGDFNQSRDGSTWYGTAEGRSRLDTALAGAGLACVTEIDVVAAGCSPIRIWSTTSLSPTMSLSPA